MSDPTRIPGRSRCARSPALLILSAVLAAGAGACGGDDDGTEPELPASVVVASPIGAVMATDHTVQLTATARDASGEPMQGQSFTWASSNPAVATVAGSGQVTGLTAGTTTITATASGVSGTLDLRVVAADLGAIETLLADPFTDRLVTGLTATHRGTVDAAIAACLDAASEGDILFLQESLQEIRAVSASDPTDRALLAVLGIIALGAETFLSL